MPDFDVHEKWAPIQVGALIKKKKTLNALRIISVSLLEYHKLRMYVFEWLSKLFSFDSPYEFDDSSVRFLQISIADL